MQPSVTQGLVRVDGASIYYERRGDGPALLLISGGMGEADHYSRAADLLASDYTVLTFDRRGNGRSRWRDPKRQFSVLQQAQDAVAVITANGFESASVYGSSSGASIVLEMITAYPQTLSCAIAHEPPIITGLPNRGEMLDWYDHLHAMALQGQTLQGHAEFFARTGLANPISAGTNARPSSPENARWRERQRRNIETFMHDEILVLAYYLPDYPRLRASDVPLVIAAGHDGLNHHGAGKPIFYSQAAQRVAERIGTELVEFPGNHVLHSVDPSTFVATLRPLLRRANNRLSNATR